MLKDNLWIYFIYTLVVSILSHRFFVIRAEKYKIKKVNVSAERWSSQTKPILGGITFYVIFLFSIINYVLIFGYANVIHLKVAGAFLVITIAFLSGLADDMLNTPPLFKFFTQFVCAGILIFSGFTINIFQSEYLNYALTAFWILGMMNSLNMLDNMDAITTSVSSTILIGFIAILSFSSFNNSLLLFMSIGCLASLIAFLYYNWHPAKMYMGDNGSQFLGAVLSILTIDIVWNNPSIQMYNPIYIIVFIVAMFIVPISDTTTVTINRLLRKQSPFVGGRDHTTHHLSYMGLTDDKVAIVLIIINALFVAVSSFILIKEDVNSKAVIVLGIVDLCVFITLYSITKITKSKK